MRPAPRAQAQNGVAQGRGMRSRDEIVGLLRSMGKFGAVGVLNKPFDPDDLVTAVQNATAFRDLHRA